MRKIHEDCLNLCEELQDRNMYRATATASTTCTHAPRTAARKHTQLRQQLVDGFDDIRLECGEMLPEVFLA